MRRLNLSAPVPRMLAALALLVALLTPLASTGASCPPLPGQAPDQPPVLRSAVGLNVPSDVLDQPAGDSVVVCVLVDSTGTVREAEVMPPAGALDLPALDAARWWVFTPARRAGRAVPARVTLKVATIVPPDADLLVPDVVALAHDAEARGNLREAIDAWTGVLARTGRHPTLQNEWAVREHVLRLAATLGPALVVPNSLVARARGTHGLMLRNIARGANEDYALKLDEVLRTAPWYGDAYRWRASARAASGQRDGAVRDVLCYRLAVRDSANRALAERALVALANADTLAALTLLKN